MDYFSGIRGHERILKILKQSAAGKNSSHAYIFWGPAGIGKMLCARAFAGALISDSDQQAEVFLSDNTHPDLLVIEKQENRSTILKEQITQEIEPWLALKPFRSNRRVVIIRDAQLMRAEAANALLKTLEEPPLYALIILVADEYELLETIVSRCQVMRFFPLPETQIEEHLLKMEIAPDKAIRAARLSRGSMADAIDFAHEESLDANYTLARKIMEDLAAGEKVAVFQAAEQMEAGPELISNMLETMLRDIIVFRHDGGKNRLVLPDNIVLLESIAKKIDEHRVRAALEQVDGLRKYYRRNVNSLILNTNIAYAVWEALN